ncbi:MAG: HAMP domain-containing histidine kinase [Acidobacteria bacterium]|nr:HAMP domain-containing histidine kinase [Acidobacteriota bacterium]
MMLEPSQIGCPLPDTYFAPAVRATEGELRAAAEACLAHPVARFFMQAAGGLVFILDGHRQVLAVNAQVMALLGPDDPSPFGRRPGELFNCIHAVEGPGGCGTSPSCAHCGAVLSLLACQRTGETVEGECQLSLRRHGRLEGAEYRILTSPLDVGPHRLFAMVLQDLSAGKRREALERLFFHDVANLMQGIRGWSELVLEGGATAQLAATKLIHLLDLLDRELRSHQDMALAESGELTPDLRPMRPSEVVAEVRDSLDRHPASHGHTLDLDLAADPLLFTDRDLLTRVIRNMVVNAMEACPAGSGVRLATSRRGERLRVEVDNPGEIPPEIRSRIFLRSFSTKGATGRGLGTYAMKLFGENVLGGEVGFTSGEGKTAFFIELPLVGARAGRPVER